MLLTKTLENDVCVVFTIVGYALTAAAGAPGVFFVEVAPIAVPCFLGRSGDVYVTFFYGRILVVESDLQFIRTHLMSFLSWRIILPQLLAVEQPA